MGTRPKLITRPCNEIFFAYVLLEPRPHFLDVAGDWRTNFMLFRDVLPEDIGNNEGPYRAIPVNFTGV
jgi:hypothetical protein